MVFSADSARAAAELPGGGAGEKVDEGPQAQGAEQRSQPHDPAQGKGRHRADGIREDPAPKIGQGQPVRHDDGNGVIGGDAQVRRLVQGAGEGQDQDSQQHEPQPPGQGGGKNKQAGDGRRPQVREDAHPEPVEKGADADEPPAAEKLQEEPDGVGGDERNGKGLADAAADGHDHGAAGVVAHQRQPEQAHPDSHDDDAADHNCAPAPPEWPVKSEHTAVLLSIKPWRRLSSLAKRRPP